MKKESIKKLIALAAKNGDKPVEWLLTDKLSDGRSKDTVIRFLNNLIEADSKVLAELRLAKLDDLCIEWEIRLHALKEIVRRGEKAKVRLTPKQVRNRLGY